MAKMESKKKLNMIGLQIQYGLQSTAQTMYDKTDISLKTTFWESRNLKTDGSVENLTLIYGHIDIMDIEITIYYVYMKK